MAPIEEARRDRYTSETVLERAWKQLFDQHERPTFRLGQLFRGIGAQMLENYGSKGALVILPDTMLRFYKHFEMPREVFPWSAVFRLDSNSLNSLYVELRCEHHFVQTADDQIPHIPALTPMGFAQWSSLLSKAHPAMEVARLNRILQELPVSNPDDLCERFPKELSRRLFPPVKDRKIYEWLHGALKRHARIAEHDQWIGKG